MTGKSCPTPCTAVRQSPRAPRGFFRDTVYPVSLFPLSPFLPFARTGGTRCPTLVAASPRCVHRVSAVETNLRRLLTADVHTGRGPVVQLRSDGARVSRGQFQKCILAKACIWSRP